MNIERSLQTKLDRRVFFGLAGGFVLNSLLSTDKTDAADHPPITPETSDDLARQIELQYAEFKNRAAQDRYHPGDIPHHTLMRYFGLNILGGDDTDVKISDIQRLPVHSVLYIGTNPEFITKVRDLNHSVQPRIIHRYYTPDNFIHWNSFRHNVDFAKKVHYDGHHPDTIVEAARPRITFLNEPNLYNSNWYRRDYGQPEISPQTFARTFMEGARFIKENNCIPLLPPLAPHTPNDERFRFGDELDYYEAFLESVSAYPDFDWIAQDMEIDLHTYVRHPGDSIWPRLRTIDGMIKNILGRRFPVHFTEFGLTNPLTEMDNVSKALEVRRVLRTGVPDGLFPIQSLNWWTLFAREPKRKSKPGEPPVENYADQSLRISEQIVGLDYHAIEYTYQERLDDIKRYNKYHGLPSPHEQVLFDRGTNY